MPIIPKTKTKMPVLPPAERRTNWQEVASGYTFAQAVAEAQRCLQCQDPVCEQGCPVNVPIREFIARIVAGDIAGASRAMRTKNLLPAICGRVCPQEIQCESRCVVFGKQQPVAVGHLERFVADWERTNLKGDDASLPSPRDQKVAVIGSGPAGLTAAADLARLGYRVTVFEALHALGGVLRYGIPEFRLPKAILVEDVARLTDLGVEFQTNVVIGKTVTIDQLFEDLGFDAVFIGTGAGTPKFMNIPGENLQGVYSANEFLTRVNLMHANDFPNHDTPVHRGSRVAVVGAGDTAMDAVRTAIRLGAAEAHIVYRRSESEMTARDEEYHHALEEGAIFDWQTQPVAVLGEAGWVRGLQCVRTELGEPDASGRRRPVDKPGSDFALDVDTVIIALGTNPNPLLPRTTAGLDTDSEGRVIASLESGATSRRGVFAGGDIVTGAATVILAMGAGRVAAAAIDRYLRNEAEHPTGDLPAEIATPKGQRQERLSAERSS
jgi:glutamate synthase (NADPH/NADH) small chain